MQAYQRRFLELAIEREVLRFGEFTLKSGRISPYFFNAGLFNTGGSLARLADCYAEALLASGLGFDMLFGPAYKGIPLATAVAGALYARGLDVPLAYNRKEAKGHGEGGVLVGAPLSGRVLIIDDVITAGTAVRESLDLIRGAGAQPCGVLVALDRQERGQGRLSAVQELEREAQLRVIAVARLEDLLAYTAETPGLASQQPRLIAYREAYGSHAGSDT